MPCKFCGSTYHTLKMCDSDIGKNMVQDVTDFIQQKKFKINDQITYLEGFTNTQLAFIAKELDITYKGSKLWLIFIIIRKYFRESTDHSLLRAMTHQEVNQIHYTYTNFQYQADMLQTPVPDSQMIIIHVKSMIDAFYDRRYGARRYGASINEYFDMLNKIAIHEPERLSFYERELREEANRIRVAESLDL